ncbi:MAG: ATP-binding protein [Bacteroidota bacterium]|nr:ATP-binding protein [Bacteroidota bacterium]
MMAKTYTENPFVTGQPARGDDFVGRVRLLNHIGRFIENEHSVNFALIGKRRSGKTSLLKKIQDTRKSPELLVLYFNMQKYVDSSMDTLLSEIKRRLMRYSGMPSASTDTKSFEEFLNSAFQYPVRRVLLLFDEFDVICSDQAEDNRKNSVLAEFVEYWTALTTYWETKKIPIKNIFASSRDFLYSESPCCYDLFKTCSKGTVTPLRRSSVEQILGMSQNMEFKNDAVLDEFYKVTAGNPYFTQVLAHTLYESDEVGEGKAVGKRLLRRSTKEALKSFGYGAAVIWGELKPLQKLVLYFISRMIREKTERNCLEITRKLINSSISLTEFETQRTLNALVREKFLCESDSGTYRFCSVFFRSWLQKSVKRRDLTSDFRKLRYEYL